jgi:hypothetical protein
MARGSMAIYKNRVAGLGDTDIPLYSTTNPFGLQYTPGYQALQRTAITGSVPLTPASISTWVENNYYLVVAGIAGLVAFMALRRGR